MRHELLARGVLTGLFKPDPEPPPPVSQERNPWPNRVGSSGALLRASSKTLNSLQKDLLERVGQKSKPIAQTRGQ